MPLYEVVLEQRYGNQQCINRWNYVGTGTPSAVQMSFALLSAMGFLPVATTLPTGTVGNALQGIQSVAVTFVQALARAIYVDTDFYNSPFLAGTAGAVGTAAGALSPTAAFGFRSSRVRQSVRRGFKRFVGVDKGMVDSGGQLVGAAQTAAVAVATRMGQTLTYNDEGNTLTFTPCIVQKEKYTTPLGNTAYRYYEDSAIQDAHLAQGILWEYYPQSRTQVSRQYGRGL